MHSKLKAETKIEKDKETRETRTVPKYTADTIEKTINRKFDLTFHNTSGFTFQKLLGDPDKLAANLSRFSAGFSTRARIILEKFKFEEEIEKLEKLLAAAFKKAGITLDAKLKTALLAPASLGEKDPTAKICHKPNGQPEPDSDLRDTENFPLPEDISLGLQGERKIRQTRSHRLARASGGLL